MNQFYGTKDPKNVITAPIYNVAGVYGKNILFADQKEFFSETAYSFAVRIPEKSILKVDILKLSGDDNSVGRMRMGTPKGWIMDIYKNNKQEFILHECDEKGELEMSFTGKGTARVSMYFIGELVSEKTFHGNRLYGIGYNLNCFNLKFFQYSISLSLFLFLQSIHIRQNCICLSQIDD